MKGKKLHRMCQEIILKKWRDSWQRTTRSCLTPILVSLGYLAKDWDWAVEVVSLVAGQRSVKEKEWLGSQINSKESGTHTLSTLRTRNPLRKLLEESLHTPSSIAHLLGKGISVWASRVQTSCGDEALIETQQHKIHFPPLFFHNTIHDTHVALISRIQRNSWNTVTFWRHVFFGSTFWIQKKSNPQSKYN